MAAAVTLAAILKTIQEDGTEDPDVALVRESALLSSIPHKKDFFGATIDWSIPYAGLGGRSMTAVNAEANDVNGAYLRFSISACHDYNDRKLDGQLVRKVLKGGVTDHFIEYSKAEMGLATAAIQQNLCRGVYASSTGRRGIRGSLLSANVLQLATIDDACFFSIGDKIQASAVDGGTLRNSGSFVTLTNVDTGTGQLTASTAWSTITSIADGDSLYVQGDQNISYHGLGDYNPAVAPTTGDAVFGANCDRSIAPEQTAGIRINATGPSVETVLIRAMAACKKRPGTGFTKAKLFASQEDMANLRIAKEGSRFVTSDGEYNLEVEGFMVGNVPVVPDVFCPTGTYKILGEGAIEMHSIDGVQIDETDGNTMRKKAGDTYGLQAIFDGDFAGKRPYAMGVGAWPAG